MGSMLFTVFQYMPILEEEIHALKSLDKKTDTPDNEKNSSDDDSGDDDNDTDELFNCTNGADLNLIFSNTKYRPVKDTYQSLVSTINTPPPKI
jgi:hypothetical protein